MGTHEPKHTEAALAELGQLEWLRALARSLTADVQAGEDAVQETAVSALKAGQKKRGWLARVLVNRLRQDHRSAVRRADRETLWAEGGGGHRDAHEGPAEIAARLDVHRLLLDAVRSLDEPYQSVIALRFLEGLSAREIAARQGIPYKTVRTHIDRGLARLRERLDKKAGGREVWLSALAPLALPPPTPLAPVIKGALPLIATLAVLLAAWGGWRLLTQPAGTGEHQPTLPTHAPDETPAPLPDDLEDPGANEPLLPESAPRFEVEPRLPLADATGEGPTSPGEATAQLELVVEPASSTLRYEDVLLRVKGVGSDESSLHALALDANGASTGRARVEVPAGGPLRVSALGRSSAEAPVRPTTVDVPALEPDETRVVRIRVAQGTDRIFYGEVVAAESGTPLPGALARRVDSRRAQLPSDFDADHDVRADAVGRFEIPFPSWTPGTLLVRDAGRGFAELPLGRVESSPESPASIRLAQDGSLAVRLTTRWPVWEGELHAFWTRGGSTQARLDEAGHALLSGLPARHAVRLELWRDGQSVARHPDTVTLEAGEAPILTWNLDQGLSVLGSMTDGHGRSLGEHRIWAVRVEANEKERWKHLLFDEDVGARVALRTTTEADGSYRLDGLTDGAWWIGPAPDERCSHASWAKRVEVETSAGGPFELTVDLVADAELYISGRLTGRGGRPFRWAQLTASPMYTAGGRSVTRVQDDGSFRVGPLARGRYLLFATGAGFMSQGRTTAEAGDDSVELHLGQGTALGGRVLDEAGQGAAAHVSLIRASGGSLGMGTTPEHDGFLFGLLSPGTYALRAASQDGRVAILGPIELEEGEALLDHDLQLAPAARLQVEYSGPKGLRCAVTQNGVRVEDASVDGDFFLTLSPGTAEVVLYGSIHGESVEVRRNTLLLEAGRIQSLSLTVTEEELGR